jgi:hypothetical protein
MVSPTGEQMEAKPMTYKEFNKKLDERPPEWRRGQAAFNLLEETHPEFAESVRGTPLDPFYDDKRLPNFLGAAHAWGAIE